jgi:hypothetical protein
MAQAKEVNLPAMEDFVYLWLSRNWYSIEDGGCGDVQALFAGIAIAAKSPVSLPSAKPKAASKSAAN